ncbi:MAG TPA: flagellar basal body-associated FliL family protein [Nitrospiraceae bacterium]|nr:flagellar basal body-associated FliL family protein [Nitrospiraceae bacterium]
MADAATADAKAIAPPRGISIKLVAIIALVTLLLGLGGAFVFFKLQSPSTANDHDPPAAAAQKDAHQSPGKATPAVKGAPGPLFDLDSFIVNLADAPESRYLKLTAKLELERGDIAGELTPRLAQVRDTILILLSSKDSATVRTPEGKFQLRDEMIQRLNALLPSGGVRSVYFTEFVVQ